MTQSMLDRIAEAIEQAVDDAGIQYFEGSDAARAALTAMMEPSDSAVSEMTGYFDAQWSGGVEPPPTSREMTEVWRLAIQAILNEGAEK